MDSDNEYRSYGSYISRVFAIIVVAVLIILSVWFVVQIATSEDDGVSNGDTTSVADESGQTNEDATVVDEAIAGGDDAVSPGDLNGQTDEAGHTLSTNTDDLPDTGPGDVLWVLPIGAAVYAGSRYIEIRKQN